MCVNCDRPLTFQVPTNSKEIADSLYSVKEQLPDGHYLTLMNLLAGKNDVPDITDAKFVEIDVERFEGIFDDEDDQIVTSVFRIKKYLKVVKISDADACHRSVNEISKSTLDRFHSALRDNSYAYYKGDVFKVHSIRVINSFDELFKNE